MGYMFLYYYQRYINIEVPGQSRATFNTAGQGYHRGSTEQTEIETEIERTREKYVGKDFSSVNLSISALTPQSTRHWTEEYTCHFPV